MYSIDDNASHLKSDAQFCVVTVFESDDVLRCVFGFSLTEIEIRIKRRNRSEKKASSASTSCMCQ